MGDLQILLGRSAAGETDLDSIGSSLKFTIQSFFALAEAVSNSFASAAIGSSKSLHAFDRAVLLGRDFDSNRDEVLETPARYSLVVRAQAAFRAFLQTCGASPRSDWPASTVAHFASVARARNRFTHPTKLEYLSPVYVLEDFRQISAWFPAETMQTLVAAAQGLGVRSLREPPEVPILAAGPAFPDPSTILGADFDRHILSRPDVAIHYIDLFSQALYRELKSVMADCSNALAPPYNEQQIGRVIRRAVRVIAQTAEGEMGFATFFLRAVRRRSGKPVVPQQVKGESVTSRIVKTLVAFSLNFGTCFEPRTDGAPWKALTRSFELRDGLIHPRRRGDVDLHVEHLSSAMEALRWLMENSFPAVALDQEKTADLVGSRRQRP